MNKTPSTILTDALAAFNKAATLALTTAQEHARKDLTQATTDARDARRERDDATKALHASSLEEQAWKQEAGVWKAAADQAKLTINHHLETIAQLRQEATQWKNQCLRLEETSRQEANSWKEQFLRVEQERTKLAQRVDELVAEQLSAGHATITTAPYTPRVRHPALSDISASARQQSSLESGSPSLELPPSKSAPSLRKSTSGVSRSRPGPVQQLPTPISENQRSARQRAAQEAPTSHQASNGSRQILIRRVQAVVEVPVKEESVEREVLPPRTHASTSTSNHASTSTSASTSISAPPSKSAKVPPSTAEPNKAATRIKRKGSAKRAYVEIDDDESERDDGSDVNSDDDDELLMGVEENRKEVYGMKRVSKPASFPKTPSRGPLNTAKKRKVPPGSSKSRPSTASKV